MCIVYLYSKNIHLLRKRLGSYSGMTSAVARGRHPSYRAAVSECCSHNNNNNNNVYIYTHIHTYIHTERERCMCVYIYIYIYTYYTS